MRAGARVSLPHGVRASTTTLPKACDVPVSLYHRDSAGESTSLIERKGVEDSVAHECMLAAVCGHKADSFQSSLLPHHDRRASLLPHHRLSPRAIV